MGRSLNKHIFLEKNTRGKTSQVGTLNYSQFMSVIPPPPLEDEAEPPLTPFVTTGEARGEEEEGPPFISAAC